MQKIRLYAGKDTGGVSKILYQWRKRRGLPASSITSGKLPTTTEAMDAFHVGVEDVNKVVGLCRSLISNGKQFAVLIPVSIAGEIARRKMIMVVGVTTKRWSEMSKGCREPS